MKSGCATAIGFILVAGCAHRPSLDEIMGSFIDHPTADLVAAWGPPARVMPDRSEEKGAEIWVYYQDKRWTMGGYSTTSTSGSYNTQGHYHGSSIFGGPGYTGNTVGGSTSQTYYSAPQTYGYVAQRMFFVNKAGVIYRYAWRGK